MIANAVINSPDDEAIAMLDAAGYDGFEARQWAYRAADAALVEFLNTECKTIDPRGYTEWLLLAVAAHEELYSREGASLKGTVH
jgi:hypothetical protein